MCRRESSVACDDRYDYCTFNCTKVLTYVQLVDKKPDNQSLLITGSSRMDTFRQSGESPAGRYFHFRLHPLSVKELKEQLPPHEALKNLNALGGFPEPFLANTDSDATRWRKQYYSDLLREDILEFSRINEIRTMRLLLEMLRTRVGSPLSFRSDRFRKSQNSIFMIRDM